MAGAALSSPRGSNASSVFGIYRGNSNSTHKDQPLYPKRYRTWKYLILVRIQPPPRQIIVLPLAGMCGGGSSGTLGAFNVTFLSVFCLVSFLFALGEELDELLELVTVSPELHGAEGMNFNRQSLALQSYFY